MIGLLRKPGDSPVAFLEWRTELSPKASAAGVELRFADEYGVQFSPKHDKPDELMV
jgi:hypothetical protein